MSRGAHRWGDAGRHLAACAFLSLAAACGGEAGRPELGMEGPVEGVVPASGLDPVLPDPARTADEELPEPPELTNIPADTVRGWTGPGGRPFEVTLRTPGSATYLHRRIGRETFPLAARETHVTLTQYPCTTCHQGLEAVGDPSVAGHPEIGRTHPSTANCATCHVPASVDQLLVAGREPVSLDHAYQLCAQCHFAQADAWAAGIHGKRLEGWTGRRVVMNCADCHNPHEPAVLPRLPYPGPRFP